MNDFPIYCFESEQGIANEIPKGVVCRNARFVFDRTVALRKNEYLALKDGQWFHVTKTGAYHLDGKWCR